MRTENRILNKITILSVLNFLILCIIPTLLISITITTCGIIIGNFNKLLIGKGYWQIFVTIPIIDMNFPNLYNNPFIRFIYVNLYVVIYFFMHIFIYIYDKRMFAKCILLNFISFAILLLLAIIFPCYCYYHDQNWQPYNKYDNANDYKAVLFANGISYHMCLIWNLYIIMRKSISKDSSKYFKIIILVWLLYCICIWIITLLVRQHSFIDFFVTVIIVETISYFLLKNKLYEAVANLYVNINFRISQNKTVLALSTILSVLIIFGTIIYIVYYLNTPLANPLL